MKTNIILGTMTFGAKCDSSTSHNMIQYFLDLGYNELDTAYVYNNGKSEEIIGGYLANDHMGNIKISTKINPRISEKLDRDSIRYQFFKSLKRLNLDYVDILYIHFPDDKEPLENILLECNNLYNNGKIKELGLSNFPSWMVVQAWYISKINGWILPTVYEGMYNAFSRNIEKELVHALRKFEIRFNAYNPLAGGLLSGKYNDYNTLPNSGRFINRPNYIDRYWSHENFEALKIVRAACDKESITIAEAAFRWLANHSVLNNDFSDSIIVGASSLDQLSQNIESIRDEVLPETILYAFDKAWNITKNSSPEYFRYVNKARDNK